MFWLLSKVGQFSPKLLVTLMMAEKKKICLVFWKATESHCMHNGTVRIKKM
jgi:hypothetical protein